MHRDFVEIAGLMAIVFFTTNWLQRRWEGAWEARLPKGRRVTVGVTGAISSVALPIVLGVAFFGFGSHTLIKDILFWCALCCAGIGWLFFGGVVLMPILFPWAVRRKK